jgi:hypothetical protein
MKKVFAIAVIWALVLGSIVVVYKVWFADRDRPAAPDRDKPVAPAREKPNPDPPRNDGPGPSKKIRLALDSFPGYCVFRSDELKKKLAARDVELELIDDKADYPGRMKTVADGQTPLAVFTLDALINACPREGDPPAAVVMLIDETRGADAMVAYSLGVRDLDALNNPRARITLVPDSPSATLARLLRREFSLDRMPARRAGYLIEAKDAEDAFEKLLHARKTEAQAFVLWEPYVTLARQDPNVQVLVDSSDFRGMIVDCLVAQPEYLHQHEDDVRAVVKAYLEVLDDAQRRPGGMERLIKADADKIGEPRVKENAAAVVKGVWWKNTRENFAHFGLLPAEDARGLQTVGDMVKNIRDLLEQTRDPGDPPTLRQPERLLDDRVLRPLQEQRLHQGVQKIREEPPLPSLSDSAWGKLRRVGMVKARPIRFTQRDNMEDAEEALAELAEKLSRWPQYYLRIEGDSFKVDAEDADYAEKRRLNMARAQRRAQAVRDHLTGTLGIPRERLLAVPLEPGGTREVRFVFLKAP